MKSFQVSKLTLFLLFGFSALFAAQPRSATADDPVVVMSVEGTDTLMSDVEYLLEATGTAGFGQFFLPTVQNYLQGINGKAPIGVTVTTDGTEFRPLAFIPVTDLKRFLSNVEEQVGEAEDAGNGVLELQGPQPIFVKEQGGWAFMGQTVEGLDDLPDDPIKMLQGLNEDYDIGVRVYVQNIPEVYRSMAIDQLSAGLEQGLEDVDDEEAIENAKAQFEQMEKSINEIDQLTFGLNIDSEKKQLFMDMALTAKEGSQLAKEMAYASEATTKFSGFIVEDAAMSGAFAGVVSEDQLDQSMAQIENLKASTLKEIANDEDLDEAGIKAATELVSGVFDIVIDTMKTGKMDAAMSVILEEKEMTMVMAAHVADSAKVEKMVQDAVEMAKKESEVTFTKLEFNSETSDGVRFHELAVAVPDEEYINEVFNGELEVCLGATDGAVYIAVGSDPKDHLKKMISASKSSPDKKILPAEFMMKLLPIMEFAQSMEDNPMVASIVDMLSTSGNDHVRIQVMPKDGGFVYRFLMEDGVLRSIGQSIQAQMAGGF